MMKIFQYRRALNPFQYARKLQLEYFDYYVFLKKLEVHGGMVNYFIREFS